MINLKQSMRSTNSTAKIMRLVSLALLPGILVEFYYFGWGVLINVCLCSFYAVLAEAFILKLRNRPIKQTLSDNSALLTGILIALSIPPILPWWMSLIGVGFAIIFAKQLYGGLGFNPFNPAMVGYVLLLISFPTEMTSWLPNVDLAIQTPSFTESCSLIFGSYFGTNIDLQDFRLLADGFTMATPLDESKTSFSKGFMTSEIIHSKNFRLNFNAWFIINSSFLAGGLYLLYQRIIQWYIPISFLLALFIGALFFSTLDSERYLPAWIHLFSGATMLGAFFIATDPVSAATTPKGRLIYGASIGFLIIIIRTLGGYPDAVAFSVLLLNIAVPTVDHYTKPRIYGSQLKDSSHAE